MYLVKVLKMFYDCTIGGIRDDGETFVVNTKERLNQLTVNSPIGCPLVEVIETHEPEKKEIKEQEPKVGRIDSTQVKIGGNKNGRKNNSNRQRKNS